MKIKVFLAILATAGFGVNAMACDLSDGGFFAAVVECVAPPLAPIAEAADDLNGRLGRPVDHAAAAIADGFIPGAGAALEAGWEIQRSGILDQRNLPMPVMHNGQFSPQRYPQAVPMGIHCATQTGFHPMNFPLPIGAPCSGVNQWGAYEAGMVR